MIARRLTQLAALGAVAAAVLSSCGSGSQTRAAASGPGADRSLIAALPGPRLGSSISAIVSRLSQRRLAGQRVIFSYEGLTPPPQLMERIREGEAGGVILFAENIGSDSQLSQVVESMQRAATAGPVSLPLPILVDQEGGLVRRLPGAPGLSEKQIGQAADPLAAASEAGRGAALNLKSIGVNVNLAPVLAVSRSQSDLIARDERSYGSNALAVSELGSAFVSAQQRHGVAATAKHFPGLGDAGEGNTDLEPVRVAAPLGELREVDEAPFAAAISAGVHLVMVSWATYDALDPTRPAGLSPKVVEGELRGRLGFEGVTITDALNAGALRGFGGTERRALLAAGAGIDMLLCSGHTIEEGEAATEALSEAMRTGHMSVAANEAIVDRILALRRDLAR